MAKLVYSPSFAELLDSIDSEAGTRIEKREICRSNRFGVFFFQQTIETAFKSIYVPFYVSIDTGVLTGHRCDKLFLIVRH